MIYLPIRLTEQHVTASVEDAPVLQSHHWRLIRNDIVTCVTTATGQYATRTLDSVLFNLGGLLDTVYHVNGNAFDYTRENVRFNSPNSKLANSYINAGALTYLVLPDATTVLIDTEDSLRCQLYNWTITRNEKGAVTIRAYYQQDGQRKQIVLPRYILRETSKHTVIEYANNDVFDLRKSNLRVRG